MKTFIAEECMYPAERKFVNTAQAGVAALTALLGGAQAADGPGANPHSLAMRTLNDIKLAAQSVQARAVYRSALLCADIVARHSFSSPDGARKISAAISELSHLISMYADGLNEIDPQAESRAGPLQPQQPSTQEMMPASKSATDAAAANDRAARILEPLLPLVKDQPLKTALGTLMRLPKTAEKEPGIEPADERGVSLSFDALMRPVTNLVLSEARHCGKAVSVSYAADFDAVRQDACEDLQNLLEIICLAIVTRGIVGPAAMRGGKRSGFTPQTQISITGKQAGENLQFHIAWRGGAFDLSQGGSAHFAQTVKALTMRGGRIDMQPELKLSLAPSLDGNSPARAQQSLTVQYPLRARQPQSPQLVTTEKPAAVTSAKAANTAPSVPVVIEDMDAVLAASAGGA